MYLICQERFRSMSRSYYHDAVGTLLVYDITNRDSYNALGQWLSDVRQLAGPGVVVVLVGNKKDLQETHGQVTHWEAKQFASENDLHFIETSALTGENVEDTFTQCTRSILVKLKTGELDPDRLGPVRHHVAKLASSGSVRPGQRIRPDSSSFPFRTNECSC
ncbi:unnamed protein product [Protopolystoma xenopodis]|uniref:Uncharacterized protein n=1 Tax=Protopolystoma xenopodis TaxID=117903 RepID=A0A448WDX6_9PLAT|nr:unnamed protein product [Protopolystoma xenopodis]